MNNADIYIEKLKLSAHPEGGYFKEIYRSEEIVESNSLPERYAGSRSFSTSIYFLLKGKQRSKLHKLKSDETWHFYDGSSIKLYIIDKKGVLTKILIGRDINEGEVLQYTIQKEKWFCAEVINKKSFSLIGCTVSPGFDFSDFELGIRENLLKLFPQHGGLINEFTSD